MRVQMSVCLATMLLVMFARAVPAAFILEVENTPMLQPGTVASLNVTARSDSGAQLVSGFDLKFDIQPPAGVGRPAGITNAATFITNPVFPAPGSVTLLASTTADVYVNGDYGGAAFLSVDSAKITLFTMRFDLSSTLAAGTYAVNLVDTRPAGAFGVYNNSALDIAPLTFIQGSINVAAIPEPSSATLLGCAIAFTAFRRSRRATRHS